jgi:hypothetical protein
MSLIEHPRITAQREKRQKMLAEIQYENGWSRDELAEHFRQMAEGNTEQVAPTGTIIYNSADQVLKYLTPPRRKKK